MRIAQRLVIHGRVQGVGYRDSLCREAGRLGVTGWVRNRRDGTVEATVCGDEDSIAVIVRWCQRGPPAARVTRIDITEAEGEFDMFEFRPSV